MANRNSCVTTFEWFDSIFLNTLGSVFFFFLTNILIFFFVFRKYTSLCSLRFRTFYLNLCFMQSRFAVSTFSYAEYFVANNAIRKISWLIIYESWHEKSSLIKHHRPLTNKFDNIHCTYNEVFSGPWTLGFSKRECACGPKRLLCQFLLCHVMPDILVVIPLAL